jgi:hypothetical protein
VLYIDACKRYNVQRSAERAVAPSKRVNIVSQLEERSLAVRDRKGGYCGPRSGNVFGSAVPAKPGLHACAIAIAVACLCTIFAMEADTSLAQARKLLSKVST